jgi:hypothetical protein
MEEIVMTPTFLLSQFSVTGYYGQVGQSPRRTVLDIKKNEYEGKSHDLMVIMMNPGSSSPQGDWSESLNRSVPAHPDNTQYQIMRFMARTDLKSARILNLSDIILTKSHSFYGEIDPDENKNPHSVFSNKRRKELDGLFISDVPILLAWGVNDKLLPLINPAMKYLSIMRQRCFGYLKPMSTDRFYHPLPPRTHLQEVWVTKCVESFTMKF